ncbi:hypothetical protein LPJ64_001309 [Coemansia asiatica]|uniref:ENTH domain-containing protein n=1 Tax=Coemansia asiatica TaxID=1052880 RepID=A0A9W8CKP7_9FUNG|nr:hypothetical protein LPJ64_001309 [Coemansia asiatica]
MEKAVFKATRKDIVHPKQKHVDTLIQMTLSGASMEELFMLIQDRFSEANWVISFKALIVTHILMQEGNGPMIYEYLIHHPNALDMTRFRDKHGTKGVSEFEQSKNVRTYAAYLNDKVLAYKAIRIDHITQKNPPGSQIYLKSPTDIKFMLLEVATVQKQLHSVLKNRFDSDTLDNETTFSAFRYCLRDMLKLFQVMNLGVMKMLKVYFEMREDDMKRALDLYKRFVKLTDRTDEYLKISRQFEAIFGFSIPNLTHAPLSLSKALEDFLNMPEDERKTAVTQMKSTAKKPEATSGGGQQQNMQSGSVRRGPGGKSKPDYGLRLKPELLENAEKPTQKSDTKTKPSETLATKTLSSAKPAAIEASANAVGSAKAVEIDFIDFFSSIDDEMTTVAGVPVVVPAAANQPQQQQQGFQQIQPFGQMDMSAQQQHQQQPSLATADFDTMFNALSNPFAATSVNNNNNGININNAFDTSVSFGVQQQQQQPLQASMTDNSAMILNSGNQPFGTFSGSMSSVGLPASMNDVGPHFASFQHHQPQQQQQQNNMGFSQVSANNPFRQSMYPADTSSSSQQLTSQINQMSLQPTVATNNISYNPFTQRQTMYMESGSTTAFNQQSGTMSNNTVSPFANGGGANNNDQFGHFSAAFGNTTSMANHQNNPPTGVHGLQGSTNNANFADFDFFK